MEVPLLKNPKILILDDLTSSVDAQTACISKWPHKRKWMIQCQIHHTLPARATLRALVSDIKIKGSISTMFAGFKTQNYITMLKSQVPEEAAESICIFGIIDACIEHVEGFQKVGATQMIIFTTSEETIINFREVINYFIEQNK